MTLNAIWEMLKRTAENWIDAKAPRLAAALAYYTIFSAAPLLIIVVGIAGLVFGQDAAEGRIVHEIDGLVGREGATFIQTLLQNSRRENDGVIAAIVGFVTLIVGATGAFIELQDALNTVWGVKPKPGRGIKGMLRDRLLSFAMVLGIGFLLLVLLVLSAAIAALSDFVGRHFTDTANVAIIQIVNMVMSLFFVTFVFAMIYKVLPDVRIDWSDVMIGAVITSVLFTAGKYLIGLYLGQSSISSTYGAAGSLAVLFVWVYYSSLILFFGAEFTQVYANRFGSHVLPSDNAVYASPQRNPTLAAKPIDGIDQEKKPAAHAAREAESARLAKKVEKEEKAAGISESNEDDQPPKEPDDERRDRKIKMPTETQSAKTRSIPRV